MIGLKGLKTEGSPVLAKFPWKTLRDLIVISLLALPIFLRVGFGGGQIRPSDSDFPLYPSDYEYQLSFTWYQKGWVFGSNGAYTSLAQQPFYLLPIVLEIAGLSANLVNLGTLFILYSLLGTSAYLMAIRLLPRRNRLASIACGAFYMYNPYITGETYLGHWFSFYSYAALPILVLSVVKGLQSPSHWKVWALSVAPLSVFIAHRSRMVPIVAEFLGIYLLLNLVQHRSVQTVRRTLGFLAISGMATTMANSWWIIPSLEARSAVFALLTNLTIDSSTGITIPPSFLDPLNVLRLVGAGIPTWLGVGLFYETGIGAVTAIVIVILAYGGAFVRRNDQIVKYFAIGAACFTIPMLLISQSPLVQNAYFQLQANTPSPFNLLLFPYSFEFWSIPIALSYSFLLATSADHIEKRWPAFLTYWGRWQRVLLVSRGKWLTKISRRLSNLKWHQGLVPTLMVGLVLANSLPLIMGVSGDYISPISVPSYYQDARGWLLSQPQDFAILGVPRSQFLQFLQFDWAYNGHYLVTDILPQVSPALLISPNIAPGSREGTGVIDLTYDSLGTTPVRGLLSMMGVKYVVSRNDVITAEPGLDRVSWTREGLVLAKTIGKLDFYENQGYAPLISDMQQIIPVWGESNALLPLIYYPNLSFASSALIFSGDVSRGDFSYMLNDSRQLMVFDQPVNDTNTVNQILSQGVRVSYLLDDSPDAYSTILQGGNYQEKTVFWNGTTVDQSANLAKDVNIYTTHLQTALPNNSFTSSGTSVNGDAASFLNDTATGTPEIQWRADSQVTGFHALYLNLNQSAWNLSSLSSRGGGLSLEVYGDGSGREVRFAFMAPQSHYFYWPLQKILLNWTGWKTIFLPLGNFLETGSPSWDQVTALWIWQDIPTSSTTPMTLSLKALNQDITPRFSLFIPPSSNLAATTNSENSSTLTWTKESPSEYKAAVNSPTPTVLRLNVAYDQNWEATSNGIALKHFQVDTYSNGFLVPPSQAGASIVVTYKGQDLVGYGRYASFASLLVIGLILLGSSLSEDITIKATADVRIVLTKIFQRNGSSR